MASQTPLDGSPPIYLFHCALSTTAVPPSPSAQLVWRTAVQISQQLHVSRGLVLASIRSFERANLPFTKFSRQSTKPPSKPQCILEVLDRNLYRAKNDSHNLSSEWQIRWRDKKTIREEWMSRTKLTKLFGPLEAAEAVRNFTEGDPAPAEKGRSLKNR